VFKDIFGGSAIVIVLVSLMLFLPALSVHVTFQYFVPSVSPEIRLFVKLPFVAVRLSSIVPSILISQSSNVSKVSFTVKLKFTELVGIVPASVGKFRNVSGLFRSTVKSLVVGAS